MTGSRSKRSRRMRAIGVIAAAMALALVAAYIPTASAGSGGDEGDTHDWRLGATDDIDFKANLYSSFNATPYFMFTMVYDLLLNYDLKTAEPDPEHSLATGYEVSDDGKTYTFTLREGVKWADGVPFTGEDVVFSWNLVKDNETTLSGYAREVKSVRAEGSSVVISLNKPDARIPSAYVPIVPKHIWEKADPKKVKNYDPMQPTGADGSGPKAIIGTGPFMVTKIDPKGTSILEPNPNFYGDVGQIDRILITKYGQPEGMLRDIKLSRLDATLTADSAWKNGLEGDKDVRFWQAPAPGFEEIAFNSCPPGGKEACTGPGKDVRVEVVQDPAVRKALAWSIDRGDLARSVWNGTAAPGNGLISPFYARYFQSFADDPEVGYGFDPAKARDIMKQGGWDCPAGGGVCTRDGEQARFQLLVRSTNAEEKRASQRIKAWAADVGIRIDLSLVTEDTINARIYNTSPSDEDKYEPTFDAFLWNWGGDVPTPDFNLEVLQCGSGWTDSFYCNPEYDRLSQGALTEVDFEKRKQMMHEAEKISLRDLPYIPIVHDGYLYTTRNDTWTGYVTSPGPDGSPFTIAWLQLTQLEPGTEAESSSGGIVLVGGAVVVVALLIGGFILLRRRRERSEAIELPDEALER
jgi:peptide/nickel transport system substrate-binding protein